MSRKRVVIDITSLVEVDFVSGIQRVVREIVTRMVMQRSNPDTKIQLVAYSLKKLGYYTIPKQKFLDCYQSGAVQPAALLDGDAFSFDELGKEDLFFDIDSVWNNRMRRSFLLPILKKQQVAVAVQIYDIIPVLYPEYCDQQTTLRFMDYLGAHLLYADLVIANTKSTLRDVRALSVRIGTRPIPGVCAPLGASSGAKSGASSGAKSVGDFSLDVRDRPKVDPKAAAIGNTKYLLMVGTIEPRKNHGFMLDAYEAALRDAGFGLVIAGRKGWNVDPVMARIETLQKNSGQFLYLDHANDVTIEYLYEHAFFTVFPTQYEGFGLPVIESILHRTPVIASDIPVLREVGGDYCEYFALNDMSDLLRILLKYDRNPKEYSRCKDKLRSYEPFTWDQSEEIMWNALMQIGNSESLREKNGS